MSSENRLFLCRSSFVLFCLAPTLLVAFWILFLRPAVTPPEELAAWQAAISQRTGLDVRFGGVSFTDAGNPLIEDLQILEPETGAVVARARSLEVAHSERGWVLFASYPELRLDQLPACWEAVHQRVLRRRERLDGDVHLVARRITLLAASSDDKQPPRAETFVDFECWLRQTGNESELAVQFRRDEVGAAEIAKFRAVRKRGGPQPSTHWSLDTQGTPLPCWVLAEQTPALAALGEACEFQGRVWGELTAAGWQGDIGGKFHRVDLDRLVTYQFPHKLSGEAEIAFSTPARFENSRLIAGSGSIVSNGGAIGGSLLEAVAEAFPLEAPRKLAKNNRYEKLAVGFDISAAGLTLSGNCGGAVEGALVVDHQGALLVESQRTARPIVALVHALVPTSEVQVPATTQTAPLLQVLPIPSVMPAESNDRPPTSPLRLRGE